jgi:hypothetical protein
MGEAAAPALPPAPCCCWPLDWLQRCQLTTLALLAAALWCYLAVQRARPGLPRLLLALPVLLLQFGVPLLFDAVTEPLSRMGASFLAFRMASAKVSCWGVRYQPAGCMSAWCPTLRAPAAPPTPPAACWCLARTPGARALASGLAG